MTEQCRDKKELNILCQTLLNLALTEITKEGINPLLVETYRSQERQEELWAQGRTEPGNKITWTLHSIHTLRNAVDLVPQRKINDRMTAIWDSNDKETKKIISIMTKYGFEAGANWSSNSDSPHFQIKGVSTTGKVYSATNNNLFITMVIQLALNKKLKLKGDALLKVDGDWGPKTTKAINKFRLKQGWTLTGSLGAVALKRLLS